MKAYHTFKFLFILFFSMIFLQKISAQNENSSSNKSISEFINQNGYLNKNINYKGSVDLSGWTMTLGKNKAPRFIPIQKIPFKTHKTLFDPGDEHWDNKFYIPDRVSFQERAAEEIICMSAVYLLQPGDSRQIILQCGMEAAGLH